MRALLIRRPWIDMILDGQKIWEIRSTRTSLRGLIGLVASGSGTVVGVCEVFDCVGPLKPEEFRKNAKKAGMSPSQADWGDYLHTYAWALKNARRLERPVTYHHPPGAVIWVKLDATVEKKVRIQLRDC